MAYSYSESFEGGTFPSDWQQITTDTTGDWSVVETRSTDGTYSLEGDEPDTGDDSDILAYTDSYAPPSGEHHIEFDFYYDAVNVSEEYALTNFYNSDSAVDENPSNIATWGISFNVDPDRDGVREYDLQVFTQEDTSGNGRVSIGNYSLDTWYHFDILVDYPNNEQTIWFDGSNLGTYLFANDGEPSNYPWFGIQNSNSLVYLDNISAYKVPTEAPSLGASTSMKVTESLPDTADWAGSEDWRRAEKNGTVGNGSVLELEPDKTEGSASTDDEPL